MASCLRGLASDRDVCHFSRVRFLLPIPLLLVLLGSGCASAEKRAARQEASFLEGNSRLAEQRRLLAVERGDAGSQRGAEILVIDPNKAYDPSRSAVGSRTYHAGGARTKEFYFNQKTNPGSYRTRDFYGAKSAAAGGKKFATREANSRGQYEIPNANKAAETKTAPTKEAWDAGKTAEAKNLHDGQREFLGRESRKVGQSVDPATMSDWRGGGSEHVTNAGSSVEKFSTLKPLSIEDIRELLNKNK